MTDEEIDALQSGSELDRIIHEKVFGRRIVWQDGEYIGTQITTDGSQKKIYGKPHYIDPDDTTMYLHVTDGFTGMIPYYSTRMSDAWRIVELFRRGWDNHACSSIEMTVYDDADSNDCECRITGILFSGGVSIEKTMPMAICKAALRALNNV